MTSAHVRRSQTRWHHFCANATTGLVIGAATLLSACVGAKTYENNFSKNVLVHITTDPGSWLSRVRTAVDIHRVVEDCSLQYEGTLQLSEPTTAIGIAPDRWSYLVFVFASSSILSGRSGSITYETMLKVRPHYRYDATVGYQNDMYSVAIREMPPDRPTAREIEWRSISSCRPSLAQK